MHRIAALALAAVTALAAVPAAAQSIHISTDGKSPEQLRSAVAGAANQLCRSQTTTPELRFFTQDSCVRATVRAAMAHAGQAVASR
jgi:hypothetical protein